MKLVWHIARKDLRHLRFYLAGWLGLLIVLCLVVRLGWGPGLHWIAVIGVLKIALLALIVFKLVREDSPAGSTSFWLSRPVSGRRLLAAKSVVLAVTLVIPTLLVEVMFLLFNGVTTHDILRSIPETLIYTLFAVAILMMLAALTRSLSQMVALGLLLSVSMIVFLLVKAEIFFPGNRLDIDPLTRMTLTSSKWIGFFLFLSAMAAIVVCLQYLTRRSKLNAILALAGLLPCILTIEMWTWDFVAALRRPERTVVDPEKWVAGIDEQSLKFYPNASMPSRDGRLVLHGAIVVENHSFDLMVVPLQLGSKVSFGSVGPGHRGYWERDVNEYEDRQLKDMYFDYWNSKLDDGRIEAFEQALGGVRLLANEHRLEPGYVPKFLEIRQADYESDVASHGRLSAEVDFLIQRIEIVPLPMETGARYRRGSDHAEVLKVTPDGKIMRIELKESRHRSVSKQPRKRWYVLRNRSRGEALLGDGMNSNLFGVARFFLPTVSFNHLRLNFTLPLQNPSYGPEWFEGAELLRIDMTYLGVFSKSLRMDNLVMNRIPGP